MAHLLIATPVRGDVVTTAYMNAMVGLIGLLQGRGVSATHVFLESTLVARARNAYATKLLETPTFSHLLFVDADMGFRPEAVTRMLDFAKPFCGCICPYRGMDFERFHRVSREIADPRLARLVAQGYVTSDRLIAGKIERGFARTERLGMALTLLERSALERLSGAHPELWAPAEAGYVAMGVKSRAFQPFAEYRTPEGVILSEDMSFSRRWTELGGEIWACLDEPISHTGPTTFTGRFIDRLQYEYEHPPIP